LTNEKRGGLKVVVFAKSNFNLFTLRFLNKSVQVPSCERPKTSVADPDPNPDTDPSDPHVLGLLDPDPDPPVRGMDPDPDPALDPDPDHSIIMQKE
jgi:hypothetical protein